MPLLKYYQVRKFFHSRRFAVIYSATLVTIVILGYLSYSSITKLQLDQNNLGIKYNKLELQYSGLEANYSELQHNTSIIESQLDNLKSNCSSLQSQYNALQSQQDSLLSHYNNLQSNYTNLQSQQDNLLSHYNNLQSNYTNLQSQYDDLQTQQTSLQSQYTILQSQYSSLETNYTDFLAEYQRLQPVADFSYLVFTDEKGNYFAENGTTRIIDYSGTNGTYIGQQCLDALAESGGKIVFSGKISLDAPLIIQKEATTGLIEICGFGPSTQLIVGQGSDGIQIFGEQAFGYGGPYHIVIRDLVLTSEILPEGRFMNNGIYIKNWFGVDIENVMVFYANISGILIEDSADVHLNSVYVEGGGGTEYGGTEPLTGVGIWLKGSKDCYLSNCYSDTNEFGFFIDPNSESNNLPRNIFLTQCEATLNEQNGIFVSNADGIVVSDSLVEGSNSDGLMIVDSFVVDLENIFVVGNVGNGVVVTSESLNMTRCLIGIRGCFISSNNQNGIGIWAKNGNQISQVSIEGCTIIDSGTGARGNLDQPDFWDGINISNDVITGGSCKSIKIISCSLGNREETPTQKYGIRSLENSDYVQVIHNEFFQNMAGTYILVGLNNSIGENFGE